MSRPTPEARQPETGQPDTGQPETGQPALALHEIEKSFTQGKRRLHVLQGASLTVNPGEMVALVGPSGSGKSTLLNIAGLLEAPERGAVNIDGQNTARLATGGRARLRREKIGFVFQFHRLLPEFSALENIIIPQMLAGLDRKEASQRGEQLLGMVGLDERQHHRPGELSGGEQQRVAIARAVSNAPSVLLADEPTGNLDPETAHGVFRHLAAIVHSTGTAALIVTHNTELAAMMDRVVMIRGGTLSEG